jgi:hypothetical protein
MDTSSNATASKYAELAHLERAGFDCDYGFLVDVLTDAPRPDGAWLLVWYDRKNWKDGRRENLTRALCDAFAEHGAIEAERATCGDALVIVFVVSREKDCGLVVDACEKSVPIALGDYVALPDDGVLN